MSIFFKPILNVSTQIVCGHPTKCKHGVCETMLVVSLDNSVKGRTLQYLAIALVIRLKELNMICQTFRIAKLGRNLICRLALERNKCCVNLLPK